MNFGYEYFCFVIYFSEIFFVKTFFKHFIPKFFFQNFPKLIFFNFFFKIFSPNFFSQNFFFQIFFFQIFSPQFFFKNLFSNFFQHFFLRALLSMPPRLQRQNELYVSVLWKIWLMIWWSGRNWTLFLCDKVLFFGSYCSHHTRPEKFNSFPATHNILLYFFQNLLYLTKVLKFFLDGI